MTRTALPLVFLLVVGLLTACGGDEPTITTGDEQGSKPTADAGGPAETATDEVDPAPDGESSTNGSEDATEPAAAEAPDMWVPSPRDGREVRGEMTYAFKPGPEGQAPKRGGEVTFGILEDIDSFNPFLASSVTASEVHDQIYPRLMHEQPNYYDGVPTFTPYIAESWEIADDNLSIRFKLRECTWSDGTPITAHDVRFSWQAARNPDVSWVSASIVDFIKDIEVHDDRSFTVHYTRAQPYNIMDINDVQVLPRHTFGTVPFGKWRGYPEWPTLAKKACGGPFVLDRHDPGERIVLRPNPKYVEKGKPYIDRLVFVRFGSMGTMLNALLAGQLDVMQSVRPEKARRALEAEHLNLFTYVTRSYGYLGWNCKRWPFDDKRVRQAMTYAIDRGDIVESIFAGYAKVAGPNIIRSMWASDHSIRPYPYDPEKAVALLEEAGFAKNADGLMEKDGKVLAFKLKTNQGNDVRKAICEYAQADLAEIGVAAQISITDFNQMSEQLKMHNFDAFCGGWYIATKIDPKPTFHSTSTEGSYNYVNFYTDELDELIDKGRVMNIRDPKIRVEAQKVWDRFQAILYEEQPYTMVYEPRGLVGVHQRFVNVRVTSLRALDNVHEWWVND
jgi:peptide/nickel transport system substrate-binding protein